MSIAQVESPNITGGSPHRYTDSNVQGIRFIPPRSASRMSHTPVIDLDGDEGGAQIARRSSRRIPTVVHDSDSDQRPTHRRRTTTGTQEHPVVLFDDSLSNNGRRLSNGARNSPIVVSDSDDEEGMPFASGSSTRRRTARRRRNGISSSSFRIFSPPPRQHEVLADPPIIAGPLPPAILPPASNDNRSAAASLPRPDNPIARNGPGIQLGGGLLSRAVSPRNRRTGGFTLSGLFNSFRSVGMEPPFHQRHNVGFGAHARIPHEEYFPLQRFFFNLHAHAPDHDPDAGGGVWGRHDAAAGLGPDYEPSMTHPGRAGPGWTYDFGAEEGGAGDEGAEILVCALCLDPLLANADGMVEVSDEERRDRRVWGLRCGHVLDGKCVGRLMRPDDEVGSTGSGEGLSKAVEGKGKGKQKANGEEQEVDIMVLPRDVKGKGKAPATPPRAPTPPAPVEVMDSPIASALPDNSIRSRLRPRGQPNSPASSSEPHVRTMRRSRGTKRKRDAEVDVEPVEDRYEWMCPVAGCGRTHLSIKIGGVWKMDADDGAVGVFV